MKRFAAWPAWAFMLVFFALPLLALLPESLSDGGTAFGRVIGDNLFFAAMRNTILLAAVSGVYYWRAKTEEKHLLGDPAYYSRFGFVADPKLTLDGVPPEYFMRVAFSPVYGGGTVSYHPGIYG